MRSAQLRQLTENAPVRESLRNSAQPVLTERIRSIGAAYGLPCERANSSTIGHVRRDSRDILLTKSGAEPVADGFDSPDRSRAYNLLANNARPEAPEGSFPPFFKCNGGRAATDSFKAGGGFESIRATAI